MNKKGPQEQEITMELTTAVRNERLLLLAIANKDNTAVLRKHTVSVINLLGMIVPWEGSHEAPCEQGGSSP